MSFKLVFMRAFLVLDWAIQSMVSSLLRSALRLCRPQIAFLKRRSFVSQLELRLANAQSSKKEFGLLVVDIVNLKTIEREWGPVTANACVAHVSRTLNTMAMANDLTGKVDGARFALACLGPCSGEQLQNMGLHVIASGLAEHEGLLANVSLRIRVVAAEFNTRGVSVARMVRRMEYVLQHSPNPFTWINRPFVLADQGT